MEVEAIKMKTNELVSALVVMDNERAALVKEINSYKAELMARGLVILEDTNTRQVKFASPTGSCSVTDALKLTVINDRRLKELLPEGIYQKFTTITETVDYKYDAKLETALKAIFQGDYTFEMTLTEYLEAMSVTPDEKQKKILLKKLVGDYKKDRKTLCAVFGTKEDDQFDVDLFYIYQIKNAELIKMILGEEELDVQIAELKKCMIVESSLKIEIEANKIKKTEEA